MEQIITTTVVTLISGAIGAIIGTYGGALFAAKIGRASCRERV